MVQPLDVSRGEEGGLIAPHGFERCCRGPRYFTSLMTGHTGVIDRLSFFKRFQVARQTGAEILQGFGICSGGST